jgi:GTP-binding protein EngB required for normal cell division
MMLDFLNQSGIPYIVVATKCDKLNATERKKSTELLENHPLIAEGTPIIFFSSLKNQGKPEVWKQISAAADIKLS